MAMEWACKQNTDGFVNKYSLEQDYLKEFDIVIGYRADDSYFSFAESFSWITNEKIFASRETCWLFL